MTVSLDIFRDFTILFETFRNFSRLFETFRDFQISKTSWIWWSTLWKRWSTSWKRWSTMDKMSIWCFPWSIWYFPWSTWTKVARSPTIFKLVGPCEILSHGQKFIFLSTTLSSEFLSLSSASQSKSTIKTAAQSKYLSTETLHHQSRLKHASSQKRYPKNCHL